MHEKQKKALKIVNYSGFAAVTLVIAGTVMLGIMPMRHSAHADAIAAGELQDSMLRLDLLHQADARAQLQIQDAQVRLDAAEKRLPIGKPGAAFNNELTAVAQASGIRIEQMPGGSKVTDFGAYKSIQVTIMGSGDWQSCYKFLAGLRSMHQISRLDSVLMEMPTTDAKARAGDRVDCQITVKFSTFYMEQ